MTMMRRVPGFLPLVMGAALAAALLAAGGGARPSVMGALLAAALVTSAPARRGIVSHVAARRG